MLLTERVRQTSWVGVKGTAALPPGLKMVLGECGKDFNTPTSVRFVRKDSISATLAHEMDF
jgi:hypothetical protein